MAEKLSVNTVDGFADWAINLASAIDRNDDNDFFDLMLGSIARLLPHDMAMIFVCSQNASPILIHDNFCDRDTKRGLINYVKNTYVLNPAYNAFHSGDRFVATGDRKLHEQTSQILNTV